MIRGYIDEVGPAAIKGWAYSAAAPVTGQQILAFDGGQCIGAGTVGEYRPDLHGAGLGDGKLGFTIPCDPTSLKRAAFLNVRLENSDFMLIPTQSTSARDSSAIGSHFHPFTQREVDRLAWMAAQGWLTHDQAHMATTLSLTGAYLRSYSRNESSQVPLTEQLTKLLCSCLSLMFRKSFEREQFRCDETRDIPAIVQRLGSRPFEERILGILGSGTMLSVREGAHSPDIEAESLQVTTHRLSPFQAMVVHADCLQSVTNELGLPMTAIYMDDQGD